MKYNKGKDKVGKRDEVRNEINTKTVIFETLPLVRNGSEIWCQAFSSITTRFKITQQ